jgi:hypothetical protein
MFCAPGHVFDGMESVRSRFHVLRSRTRFRRLRGRRVPFSCFMRPNSFSTVSTTSGPVFMFCTPRHIFDGAKGVGSNFRVLRSRTRFRRFRGRPIPFTCFASCTHFRRLQRRPVPFLCFALSNTFFGGSEGVGSRFQVLRSRTRFIGMEGVGSCVHILRSLTCFR